VAAGAVVSSAATVELVVGATVELVVAILLELVLAFVVDVKTFGVLLVVALVVELVGVGVSDPDPCAKAQFEQWYKLGE